MSATPPALPVHVGNAYPASVRSALVECSKSQVDEFFRRWVSSSAGVASLAQIAREVSSMGVGGGPVDTLGNALMSPGRIVPTGMAASVGSPRSPGRGALSPFSGGSASMPPRSGISPPPLSPGSSVRSPHLSSPGTSPRMSGPAQSGGQPHAGAPASAGDDAFPSESLLAASELGAAVAAAAVAAASPTSQAAAVGSALGSAARSPNGERGEGGSSGGGGATSLAGGVPHLGRLDDSGGGGGFPAFGASSGLGGDASASGGSGMGSPNSGIRLSSTSPSRSGGGGGSSSSGGGAMSIASSTALELDEAGSSASSSPSSHSMGSGGHLSKSLPHVRPLNASSFLPNSATAVSSPASSPALSAASSPSTSPEASSSHPSDPTTSTRLVDAMLALTLNVDVARASPLSAVTAAVSSGLTKLPSPTPRTSTAPLSPPSAPPPHSSSTSAMEGKEDGATPTSSKAAGVAGVEAIKGGAGAGAGAGGGAGAAATTASTSSSGGAVVAPASLPPSPPITTAPTPPPRASGAATALPVFFKPSEGPVPLLGRVVEKSATSATGKGGVGVGVSLGAGGDPSFSPLPVALSSLSANRGRIPGRLGATASSTLASRLPAIIEKFTELNAAAGGGVKAPENPFARSNAGVVAAATAYAAAKKAGKVSSSKGGKGGAGGLVAGGRGGGVTTPSNSAKGRSGSGSGAGLLDGDEEEDKLPPTDTLPGFVSVKVCIGGGGGGVGLKGVAPPPSSSSLPSASLTWEQAHLSLSVENFAAVAKPIVGFPSFFAAPLFRRIKRQFPVTRIDVPQAWASECASLASSATAHTAFATATAAAATAAAGEVAVAAGAGAGAGVGRSGSASRGGKPTGPTPTLAVTGTAALKGGSGAGGAGGKVVVPPQPTPLPPSSERTTHFSSPPLDFSASPSAAAALVSDRDTSGVITLPQFLAWWLAEVEPFDPTTRFFRLVKQPTAPAIEPSDFQPIMEELLAFHPGLEFLQQTAEFQEKYVRTVIARIFFEWDPPHRRALSLRTLRRSNLVEAFHEVDIQNDINQVNEYFSYEHFYVLYCKFWELDTDHDYFLSRADLARMTHITPLALDRVYAQAGKPFIGGGGAAKAMGYEDFICFFLASEDKTMPASLKYWFNVCDLDGDGVLTSSDLFPFYSQQCVKMLEVGGEVVKFEDVLCQFADLLRPARPGSIRIEDFLNPERVKLTGCFFNALFDLGKFHRFEAREVRMVKQGENYDASHSQWNCYAVEEYRRLAQDEESNNNNDVCQPQRGGCDPLGDVKCEGEETLGDSPAHTH